MSFIESLRNVGNKLGLVKVIDMPDPAKPQKITTRTVTLKDLTTEVRAEEVQALAELPAELSVAFEQVFVAAGVKAAEHGWSVEKLRELLGTDQYRQMPRDQAQRAILGILSAQKAPVEDLVKDAMARDQAIDAFGAFVHQKMQARRDARLHRQAELANQIQELQNQIGRLEEDAKGDEQRWREWWQKKLGYEKALAAAISYLLDKPVITIDETMPGEHNSR